MSLYGAPMVGNRLSSGWHQSYLVRGERAGTNQLRGLGDLNRVAEIRFGCRGQLRGNYDETLIDLVKSARDGRVDIPA